LVNQHFCPVGVFDDPRFGALAVECSTRYTSEQPFPHAMFDDFLPGWLALELSRAVPARDRLSWIECQNANARKSYQHDETQLPHSLREMLREFNSRQFVLFLETLTGIDGLIPDPYFVGGGLHVSTRGHYLKIHTDFNWHHKLRAHRRVNVLLYLNEGWDEAWGGSIELWNEGLNERVRCYSPLLNRALIFNTSETSHHGHPQPLDCPEGIQRAALNLYYYTTQRDPAEITEPHFTLYKEAKDPFSVEIKAKYLAASQEGQPAE
jgi:hypothetical protein